jgi:hypothetical protein
VSINTLTLAVQGGLREVCDSGRYSDRINVLINLERHLYDHLLAVGATGIEVRPVVSRSVIRVEAESTLCRIGPDTGSAR